MNKGIKSPTWFYIVVVIALIWNLLGVFAYLSEVLPTPEMVEKRREEMMKLIEQRPIWATVAYAVAVWGGALGCLFLILKRKLAHTILVLSFIGVVVQMIYNLFIAESAVSYGPFQIAMIILIPVIGLLLVLLAKKGKRVGWLK